ncbi:MAG: hypothetical protein AAF958_02720 [Planctomycetota bacterium]
MQARSAAAQRGYRYLIETPVLTPDFDQETFDQVWRAWPESLRKQAENADLETRRAMAFERYGLTPRPGDDSGKPLQYVVDGAGQWTMNCFACHGGSIAGRSTPGAPNRHFGLQTLTEEIRKTKTLIGKPFSRMDLGALVIPLGGTHGTTNAVVFGMGLMSNRDTDLNYIPKPPQWFTHHDMDAPAWWNFHKRPNLYIDGFAEKGHRGLMQFTLIPENGADVFREREDSFRDVYAFLESLRPPKFPGPIDAQLASRGQRVFLENCKTCHGSYGDDPSYPNRRVPLDVVGTDPVRLTALSVAGRTKYAESWFAVRDDGSRQDITRDPDGYVAPPLDGISMSGPYFHNGSVPTLWHVLRPGKRPTIWRTLGDELDLQRVGIAFEEVQRVPHESDDIAFKRRHFDTRRFGKSNTGHDFADGLNEAEKVALLEYLKTL